MRLEMFSRVLSLICFQLIASSNAIAGTFTVFGPEIFERETGKPLVVTTSFVAPAERSDYIFKVESENAASAIIGLNGVEKLGTSDFNQTVSSLNRQVTLSTNNELSIELRGIPGSVLTVEILGVDNVPPTITYSVSPVANSVGWYNQDVTITFECNDDFSGVASCTDPLVVSSEGENQTITGTVFDKAGNQSSVDVVVNIDKTAPTISINAPANNSTVNVETVTVSGSVSDSNPITSVTVGGEIVTLANYQFSHIVSLQAGENNIIVAAKDIADNISDSVVTVTYEMGSGHEIPPDPSEVATPLSTTSNTSYLDSIAFLFSGQNPIQMGVSEGTILPLQASVLRGKVMDMERNPISGVTVSVHNHPEYGKTLTRADGMFDLAINGGRNYTLEYRIPNYLPGQRKVQVGWGDYFVVEDIVLVTLDSSVTIISMPAGLPQMAEGSVVYDKDGSRQARVYFPANTAAEMVMPNGGSSTLNTLSVRATEFTVGDSGPIAMPGELPNTTSYTYAAEFSVDEALMAGASSVRFNQPISVYVDNFLSLPVGWKVPVGYYDLDKTAWIPSNDGLIIGIVGESNGMALVDINGSGQAASDATLENLGITQQERGQLAATYNVGDSLWRVQTTHFTPLDLNWLTYLPEDAVEPPKDLAVSEDHTEDDKSPVECGSIIECQNQTLGETVPVADTEFSLNYRSSHVEGRRAAYIANIPISGSYVPPSLQAIKLKYRIAGKNYELEFAPSPNLVHRFEWDGRDVYGRQVIGQRKLYVSVGYVYSGQYVRPNQGPTNTFARLSATPGVETDVDEARGTLTVWRSLNEIKLGNWLNLANGEGQFGGWTLSQNHSYDSSTKTIYLGNGSYRKANNLDFKVTTEIQNNRFTQCSTQPKLYLDTSSQIGAFAVDQDGGVYYSISSKIYKLFSNGDVVHIAGARVIGDSGDEGPATQARINSIRYMTVAPDGTLYFSETVFGLGGTLVRHIDQNGVIHTVAGTGYYGYNGDDIPGYMASLTNVGGIGVDKFGVIYISELGIGYDVSIRAVGTDGIIRRFVGTGSPAYNYPGDGKFATNTSILNYDIHVTPDGVVYFLNAVSTWGSSDIRLLKVGLDGRISTVAGPGGYSVPRSADGIDSNDVSLRDMIGYIAGFDVSADGVVYYGDSPSPAARVRQIGNDGIVRTIAGKYAEYYQQVPRCSDDGTFAAQSYFSSYTGGVKVAPDGTLLYRDGNDRIVRISPIYPGVTVDDITIASENGAELYVFDSTGRHLQTRYALSGELKYQFNYNDAGYLVEVVNGDGETTTIVRGAGNQALAIQSPDGLQSILSYDAYGYLNNVTSPGGRTVNMTYTPQGLLSSFTDENLHASNFTYNDVGLLQEDRNAESGFFRFDVIAKNNRLTEVQKTSALDRVSLYRLETLATGDIENSVVFSDGTTRVTTSRKDGSMSVQSPDGSMRQTVMAPDPRYGAQAAYPAESIIALPSGLTSNTVMSRTATLTNANDVSTLEQMLDKVTINGREFSFTITKQYENYQQVAVSPEGRQKSALVDKKGRLVEAQVGDLLRTEFFYDYRGRLTGTQQGARNTSMSYDSYGYLSSVTDSFNRSVQYVNDADGRVLQQILPDSQVISFGYDDAGNLLSITPPGRSAHIFHYDGINQQDTYSPPDIGIGYVNTHYSYNLDKELVEIRRPDGLTVNFDYNTQGQLATITSPRGESSFSYNPQTGQLASILTPENNLLRKGYDGPLLTSEIWSGEISGSVERVFDRNFFVAEEIVNNSSILYQYDNDGLMTQAGDLIIVNNPINGLVNQLTIGSAGTSRGYNSYGELNYDATSVAGSSLYSVNYVHDNLGRIITKTETIQGITTNYSYEYDLAGRLWIVRENNTVIAEYGYDDNGNRNEGFNLSGNISASYDGQDRLVSYNGITYGYNANGDLASKTQSGSTTTFDYDVFGNLASVSLPGGSNIEYVIDGNNRRIGKKINGVLVQGFLYQDQLNPVAELDGNGNVVARFVYADKSNVATYMVKGGQTYRIVSDHLGGPKLVVNTATGQIAQRMDYDEFGNVLVDTNPGFQPFGFAGGIYDQHTALVRFGARDYDAQVGRWTSKDPILFSGGSNFYAYVLNDPISNVDSTGLLIGATLMQALRRITGQNANEAAVAGTVGDAYASGAITALTYGNSPIPGQIGTGLDVYQTVGGAQTVGLSTAITAGLYGTGATVSTAGGAVLLPLGLAALGGAEIGFGFNNLYERLSGVSLGSDIFDLLNGNPCP